MKAKKTNSFRALKNLKFFKVYNILSIFILLSVLFSIHLVSADFEFNEFSQITISNPCFNNGAYCSDQAVCSITVFNPFDKIIVDNKAMSNNLTRFEYTLNKSIQWGTGKYKVQQVCNDQGLNGSETFYFTVKPTRQFLFLDLNTTQGIIIFIVLILICLAVLIFVHWELGCLLLLFAGVIQILNSTNIFIGVILIIVSIILTFVKKN